MSLLVLLMVPAVIALIVFLLNSTTEKKSNNSYRYGYYYRALESITPYEFAIQIGVQSLLIMAIYGMSMLGSLSDVEVWSGRVNKKLKEKVSCEHSYPCNPHSCMCDSKGNCSTCWDTCYDHSHDFDWNVYDTAQQIFTINRVDRQGLEMPPKWDSVKIGEETASRHAYTNYIKYSANSLFNRGNATTKFSYPAYPMGVHDYFKIDRLVDVDNVIQDKSAWNVAIASVSADLGNTKQVNVVMVVTKNKPPEYFNGLASAWSGAKKNDAVVVINVDDKNEIVWSDVLALSKNALFQVVLRDDINKVKTLDVNKILSAVRDNVNKHYVRRPMKDFKYLLYSTKISTGYFIFAFIMSVLVSIGLSVFMFKNDVA